MEGTKPMREQSVIHNTFVIERSYPKPPERVFAALADPAKKRRWYAESDTHDIELFETDFRVGGIERSRGVELEATLHPLPGWNLTTAYSYINAEVTQDTTLPAGTPTINAPRNIFNLWSTYEIQRGEVHGLTFGIGGRHYTDQSGDLANSFQLPGYGLLDASVTYRRGPAQWQLNADNLSNERYFAGSYNDLYVKTGEPRIVRGTFSWNF